MRVYRMMSLEYCRSAYREHCSVPSKSSIVPVLDDERASRASAPLNVDSGMGAAVMPQRIACPLWFSYRVWTGSGTSIVTRIQASETSQRAEAHSNVGISRVGPL